MPNTFEIFSIVSILLVTFAGGYLPLFRRESAGQSADFPSAEAFTSGIFLALALTIMLPASLDLFKKAFPKADFPVGSVVAIIFFLFLLSLEHVTLHLKERKKEEEGLSSPVIPVIMTVMIAIPSFFMGTALGISESTAAIMILVAILAHKGSAGFALALKMVRSTMKRPHVILLFCCFALSTPVGIIFGDEIHVLLHGKILFVIKAIVLAMASGTFLYIGTLHELRHSPLIRECHCVKGFILVIAGFLLTALIRFIIGEAHHI